MQKTKLASMFAVMMFVLMIMGTLYSSPVDAARRNIRNRVNNSVQNQTDTSVAPTRRNKNSRLSDKLDSTKLNSNAKVNPKLKARSGDDEEEADCPYGDCPDGEYCSEWTNGCCYKCATSPDDKKPLPVRSMR